MAETKNKLNRKKNGPLTIGLAILLLIVLIPLFICNKSALITINKNPIVSESQPKEVKPSVVGWKTYTSPGPCKYSLNYPADWKITVDEKVNFFIRFVGDETDITKMIQVDCQEKLEELLVPQGWVPALSMTGDSLKYYKVGNINGIEYIQTVIGPSQGANIFKTLLFKADSSVGVIIWTFIPFEETNDVDQIYKLEEYERVLSSFRFL